MNDTKSVASSIGMMGPAISLIVMLINWRYPGLGVTEQEVSGAVGQLVGGIGLIIAIYGRYTATKQVSLTGAAK